MKLRLKPCLCGPLYSLTSCQCTGWGFYQWYLGALEGSLLLRDSDALGRCCGNLSATREAGEGEYPCEYPDIPKLPELGSSGLNILDGINGER